MTIINWVFPEKVCRNCRWFLAPVHNQRNTTPESSPKCQRYPPQIYPDKRKWSERGFMRERIEPKSDLPCVMVNGRCGEWSRKR